MLWNTKVHQVDEQVTIEEYEYIYRNDGKVLVSEGGVQVAVTARVKCG